MGRFENFWIVTLVRGTIAILIGSAVLVVPDMARTILLLPFAIALAVFSLAVYGVVDSVLVFVSSFFTGLPSARFALRLQSLAGAIMGLLFASILFERAQVHWFLYLIALQGLTIAFSEFVVARHTSRRHGSRWSYAAAGVALFWAVVYAIAAPVAQKFFDTREIVFAVYAYLVAFGTAQAAIAIRMLYIKHRATALAQSRLARARLA